jgi:hypothetical protein
MAVAVCDCGECEGQWRRVAVEKVTSQSTSGPSVDFTRLQGGSAPDVCHLYDDCVCVIGPQVCVRITVSFENPGCSRFKPLLATDLFVARFCGPNVPHGA